MLNENLRSHNCQYKFKILIIYIKKYSNLVIHNIFPSFYLFTICIAIIDKV